MCAVPRDGEIAAVRFRDLCTWFRQAGMKQAQRLRKCCSGCSCRALRVVGSRLSTLLSPAFVLHIMTFGVYGAQERQTTCIVQSLALLDCIFQDEMQVQRGH
jgi:hypothetical protein